MSKIKFIRKLKYTIINSTDCHSCERRNPGYNLRIRMNYYIYILASKRNGTLYIGVTNNLIKRVYEHKNNIIKGFTAKYSVHHLVYYEHTQDIQSAINREKQLKKWKRKWKLELIEEMNPEWRDLYDDIELKLKITYNHYDVI